MVSGLELRGRFSWVFCGTARRMEQRRWRDVECQLFKVGPQEPDIQDLLPSGELTFCHGKSPFLMGKSAISMAIFNCYVSSPEGIASILS